MSRAAARRFAVAAVIAGIAALASPERSAHACTCGGIDVQRYTQRGVAFVGRAMESTRYGGSWGTQSSTLFSVQSAWRDPGVPIVRVITAWPTGGNCGLRFDRGRTLIFFATGLGVAPDGIPTIRTGVCQVRSIDQLPEIVAEAGAPPTPTGHACPRVLAAAPAARIAEALAHPDEIDGWGRTLNPNRPPSPANPWRMSLDLLDAGRAHGRFNGLQWRAGCR